MKHIVLIGCLALSPLQACATKYSAEPIRAWVVDHETNQPVEGVVVVAHWQLEGGLEGGNNIGQMMVMEAVTDSTGKFDFPAWGPKEIPGGLSIWHGNARLKNLDPRMFLFKSGYEFLQLQNHKSLDELSGYKPYVRTSEWNGKTIKIKRFKGGLKEYSQRLSRFSSFLEQTTMDEYCSDPLNGKGCSGRGVCEWKNIPRMIFAIGKQTKLFEAAKIYNSTIYNSLAHRETEEYMKQKGCGSIKEFLREHEE